MSKNRNAALQTWIFRDNLGKKVTFVMNDGETFEATLHDYDRFSILVKKKNKRQYTMLFKHAIAYMDGLNYDRTRPAPEEDE